VRKSLEHPALIVAADTIVIDGEDVLGKPCDAEEAASMLTRLRSRTHIVCTAVTVLDTATGSVRDEAPCSPVIMRAYTDQEIAAYIATSDPFDKAGGYAIQHQGFHPVESFDHCYANVMGLPICRVARLLQAFEVPLSEEALDSCRVHQTIPCPLFHS
jgi:MAF protein